MKVCLILCVLGIFGLMLGGCNDTNQHSKGGLASATLTINWPTASRLIPVASQSITVQITNSTGFLQSRIIPRPINNVSVVDFTNLPTGNLTVKATAFPNNDGTGVALATGAKSVVAASGVHFTLTITMSSTISKLVINELNPVVNPGKTLQLTVAAMDTTNGLVLVPATGYDWTVAPAGIITVNTQGLVTGLAEGQATVTVTEKESQKSTSVLITCSAVPLNATLKAYDISGRPTNKFSVAYQDGTGGAWVLVQPSSAGVYTHTVTDSKKRYGFAVYTPNSDFVEVFHATLTELPRIVYTDTAAGEGTATLSGGLTHIPQNNYAEVAWGQNTAFIEADSYSFLDQLADTHDLIAIAGVVSDIPTRFWLQRNVAVSNTTTRDIDFTGANSYPVTPVTLSFQGSDSAGNVWLDTANGTSIALTNVDFTPATQLRYGAPPIAQLLPTDTFSASIYGDNSVTKFLSFRTPADKTLNMAQTAFTSPSVNGQTFTWQAYTNAALYTIDVADANMSFHAVFTPGWLANTISYTLPDFSALNGWSIVAQPMATDFWTVSAELFNTPIANVLGALKANYPANVEMTEISKDSDPLPMTRALKQRRLTPFMRRLGMH